MQRGAKICWNMHAEPLLSSHRIPRSKREPLVGEVLEYTWTIHCPALLTFGR